MKNLIKNNIHFRVFFNLFCLYILFYLIGIIVSAEFDFRCWTFQVRNVIAVTPLILVFLYEVFRSIDLD